MIEENWHIVLKTHTHNYLLHIFLEAYNFIKHKLHINSQK